MRREYAGAARKAQLASPLGGSTLDLGIACDDLDGWPTGAGGPFWVVIGRKTPTEEKILCSSRTGNSLTVYTDGLINGRGADGTTISTHGVGEYVEHVYTATDADEANEHVNSESNVHGVVSPVVGVDDVQTLTNKTISGTANTLTNIPQSGVTGLVSKLADLDAEDVDLQNQINTKAPINNPTLTGNVVLPSTTTIGNVSSTELGYVDGATSNIQAQLNSKAPTESPIFSGTPILPGTTLIGGVTIDSITGGGLAVPPGGLTDEILVKLSDNDYDMAWKPLSYLMYIPGTGAGDEIVADGQIIGGTKTSWTDTNTGYVYNIHTFDYNPAYEWGVATDGLNCLSPVRGLLLVVAGGGAGGVSGTFSYGGGGGGGGGVMYGAYAFGTGLHSLIVGRGGQNASNDGGVSRFDDLIVPGGGGGGSTGAAGNPGGSGGGSSGNTGGGPGAGGVVTPGTGYSADFHYGNPGGWGGIGYSGNGGSSGLSTAIFDSGVLTEYAIGGAGKSGAGDAANGRGNGGNGSGPNIGSSSNYGKGGNGVIKVRYRIA